MTSNKCQTVLNAAIDCAMVELRSQGTGHAWLAELWRGDTWLYTFPPCSSGACWSSESKAKDTARRLLNSPLATELANILGDTLDVRALPLVALKQSAWEYALAHNLVESKHSPLSTTDVKNDARRVANAIRKVLKNDAWRFCAIRAALGPDLIEVCAALDNFAGTRSARGKRRIDTNEVRVMRIVCLHWRTLRGTEPGEGENDIAALTKVLLGLDCKEVVNRKNDDGLNAYVRNLLRSARKPALIAQIPSPYEDGIAKGAMSRKQ